MDYCQSDRVERQVYEISVNKENKKRKINNIVLKGN